MVGVGEATEPEPGPNPGALVSEAGKGRWELGLYSCGLDVSPDRLWGTFELVLEGWSICGEVFGVPGLLLGLDGLDQVVVGPVEVCPSRSPDGKVVGGTDE